MSFFRYQTIYIHSQSPMYVRSKPSPQVGPTCLDIGPCLYSCGRPFSMNKMDGQRQAFKWNPGFSTTQRGQFSHVDVPAYGHHVLVQWGHIPEFISRKVPPQPQLSKSRTRRSCSAHLNSCQPMGVGIGWNWKFSIRALPWTWSHGHDCNFLRAQSSTTTYMFWTLLPLKHMVTIIRSERERERELLLLTGTGRPWLLLSISGHSNPGPGTAVAALSFLNTSMDRGHMVSTPSPSYLPTFLAIHLITHLPLLLFYYYLEMDNVNTLL